MDTLKASVVVAVYNTEKYLEKCLESLEKQSYQQFEVICVDDRSTDNSYAIAEKFSKRDSRFRILQTVRESAGAGLARNTGLSAINGKYVLILDSDDFFAPDMLEKVIKKADESKADVVLFESYEYDDRDGRLSECRIALNRAKQPRENVFTTEEAGSFLFQLTSGMAWGKLFRAEFLREKEICFQEDIFHVDDMLFTYRCLANAKIISIVNDRLMYYRIHNVESQTEKKTKSPLSLCMAAKELKKLLIADGVFDKVEKSFVNMVVKENRYYLNTMKTWDAYRELYVFLKEGGLHDLGAKDKPRDYYDDAADYIWCEEIQKRSPEQMKFKEANELQELGICFAQYSFPQDLFPDGSRIAVYGAGNVGKVYYIQVLFDIRYELAAWGDKRAAELGYPLLTMEEVAKREFDYLLIGMVDKELADKVKQDFILLGVPAEKLVWIF